MRAELRLTTKLRSQRILTAREDVVGFFKSGMLRARNVAMMPEKSAVFTIALDK